MAGAALPEGCRLIEVFDRYWGKLLLNHLLGRWLGLRLRLVLALLRLRLGRQGPRLA
jgi:hypothetical protein